MKNGRSDSRKELKVGDKARSFDNLYMPPDKASHSNKLRCLTPQELTKHVIELALSSDARKKRKPLFKRIMKLGGKMVHKN